MDEHKFPIYLINLANDHKRRENSIQQLHKLGLSPHVITAYDGHQKNFSFKKYRHLSRGKWWDKNEFKPGAFACYLSHTKCWREIANGNNPYGMILEDDITINQKSFDKFNINNEMVSFDLIFVNFGVTRLLNLSSLNEGTLGNNFVSLNDLLINLFTEDKLHLTPGSYGYFVSKKGAKKLLQMMEREKICMGVDYAMIFSSLNDKNIEQLKKLKNIPNYLQCYLNNISNISFYSSPKRIILDSYVCTLPPLIYHRDDEASSIKHKVLMDFDVFDYGIWTRINVFVKKILTLAIFRKKAN